MIPDPQNVFEQLQNDVAAQLMATAPFNTLQGVDGTPFKVLTEDEGDIQFEFDANIAQLGLAIVVHGPSGVVKLTDLRGPLIDLGFDVWISEAPVFNRSPLGTQIRLMRAMKIVLGTLQGFQPASINSGIYVESFRTERERTYMNDSDKVGTLVISRIIHFAAPLVTAEIVPEP